MTQQFLIGAAIIFLSIVAQALFVGVAVTIVERRRVWAGRRLRMLKIALIVGGVALWLMAAHTLGIWLWAAMFAAFDVFADFDTALYFSAVAFTTLGFGDVIPPEAWRHLAGLCAANGLLAFGVSAAVLVEVLRQLAREDAAARFEAALEDAPPR